MMVLMRRHRRWRSLCIVILLLWLTLSCLLQLFVFSNTIYCLHWKTKQVIKNLCKDYENGIIAGEMCHNLCDTSADKQQLTIQSCYAPHLAKAVVFTANFGKQSIVMKSSYEDLASSEPFPVKIATGTEKKHGYQQSIDQLISIIKDTLSINLGDEELVLDFKDDHLILSILTKDFGLADDDDDFVSISKNINATLHSLWSLIQQKEYLTFKILENTGLFPTVIGSCGHLYAVEYYQPITEFLRSNWKLRAEIALGIFKWLEIAQFYYAQPIRICDIKLNHFGLVKSDSGPRSLRFLDADDVYFQQTLNNVVSFKNECHTQQECWYFDCKMDCSEQQGVCDTSTINNNLQVACSKLFLQPSSVTSSAFKPNFLHSLPAVDSGDEEMLKKFFKACSSHNPTQLNFDEIKYFLMNLISNY